MSSLTFFFVFVAILAILFLAVNFVLAPHIPYREKYSIFECGFHSYTHQNRTQFDVSFFQFSYVFLLLDLEVVLVFPASQAINQIQSYGIVVSVGFMFIVCAGFVFEIGKGALTIQSRQNPAGDRGAEGSQEEKSLNFWEGKGNPLKIQQDLLYYKKKR